MVWSPQLSVLLKTTPRPPSRPVTVMVLMIHWWTPPAHLHHLVTYPPVQTVKASGSTTGQKAPLPWNNQKYPPQAWPACSNFIGRQVFLLLQRPTDPLEIHPPPVHQHLYIHTNLYFHYKCLFQCTCLFSLVSLHNTSPC